MDTETQTKTCIRAMPDATEHGSGVFIDTSTAQKRAIKIQKGVISLMKSFNSFTLMPQKYIEGAGRHYAWASRMEGSARRLMRTASASLDDQSRSSIISIIAMTNKIKSSINQLRRSGSLVPSPRFGDKDGGVA